MKEDNNLNELRIVVRKMLNEISDEMIMRAQAKASEMGRTAQSKRFEDMPVEQLNKKALDVYKNLGRPQIELYYHKENVGGYPLEVPKNFFFDEIEKGGTNENPFFELNHPALKVQGLSFRTFVRTESGCN